MEYAPPAISLTISEQVIGTAPTISIDGPADGTQYDSTDIITLTGSADDAEDGTISSSINWSSSVNGDLGSGASLLLLSGVLIDGSHVITASVQDADGNTKTAKINITIGLARTVDCSIYTVKDICNADLSCKWGGRTKSCIAR